MYLKMKILNLLHITSMYEQLCVWASLVALHCKPPFLFDLCTAQVYWDAIFLVSQEVYLNFHHFYG